MELLPSPLLVKRPAVSSGRWPGVARNMRDTDAGLGGTAYGSKLRTKSAALPVKSKIGMARLLRRAIEP